ncbi:MAG: type II secretion system protein [Planctomycetota bacterium]
MTSRTGSTVGPREGPTSPVRPRNGRGERAFTLMEILVVMLLIGILAGIILPILGVVRRKAKKEWASKELSEIAAALLMYHEDHTGYPPDTEDWADSGRSVKGNVDPPTDGWSIHRYLGLPRSTKKGKTYQSYLGIRANRLGDVGGDNVGDRAGKYLDPYETPYQLDAMHMIRPNAAQGTGWRQSGWPYRLEAGDTGGDGYPTTKKMIEMVLDFKVLSCGLDKQTADYPFDLDEANDSNRGRARDDILSW